MGELEQFDDAARRWHAFVPGQQCQPVQGQLEIRRIGEPKGSATGELLDVLEESLMPAVQR